jgi:hypothetical protein
MDIGSLKDVKLYHSVLPVGPDFFDYSPAAMVELTDRHYNQGHTITADLTARGLEHADCSCGTRLITITYGDSGD